MLFGVRKIIRIVAGMAAAVAELAVAGVMVKVAGVQLTLMVGDVPLVLKGVAAEAAAKNVADSRR